MLMGTPAFLLKQAMEGFGQTMVSGSCLPLLAERHFFERSLRQTDAADQRLHHGPKYEVAINGLMESGCWG